ncbi:MAG: prenyltransferase/squalene oxidase repeat-containing protein [Planctomycetota bacterium]
MAGSTLQSAYEQARAALLHERQGTHWVGELASSALSTATAVSALSLAQPAPDSRSPLVDAGIDWLITHQNEDGGWGDTVDSVSNLSTSILVRAALKLSGRVAAEAAVDQRAQRYVESLGGHGAVQQRYGRDKTFAVPILTNAALAGLVSWREVSPLPFELAVFPQAWYRFLQMPVVSYAIPALVAIGQARFFHRPPRNPCVRWLRGRCVAPSLRVLGDMQPASGGYLEAIPLTSFVLMSLAANGQGQLEVGQNAQRFLCDTARSDGSWPIDTNLATWNTTLAMNALGLDSQWDWSSCAEWVLGCQHRQTHPFTGSPPGAWGWSDLSGAVPDADDTPGALLALRKVYDQAEPADRNRVQSAARDGIGWLLKLQNRDGGWPTFCRGWGKLPFDRSGSDLTAHALRAIHAWPELATTASAAATQRGLRYLVGQQRTDGSWLPLWFGNQFEPNDENPIYGTARVLLALTELDGEAPEAHRSGVAYLVRRQNADGGWGHRDQPGQSGVEESSVALEALLRAFSREPDAEQFVPLKSAIQRGLGWLTHAVESGEIRRASPIGLYFAKLWYHERLYPLTFAVAALRAAIECPHELSS